MHFFDLLDLVWLLCYQCHISWLGEEIAGDEELPSEVLPIKPTNFYHTLDACI